MTVMRAVMRCADYVGLVGIRDWAWGVKLALLIRHHGEQSHYGW